MNETREAALVIERWNSWVRVWLPATGELRWVEVQPEDWELLAPASSGTANLAEALSSRSPRTAPPMPG